MVFEKNWDKHDERLMDQARRAMDGVRFWDFHDNGTLYHPNPAQHDLLEAWKDPEKKVFALCGANRIGKTTIGVIIALSVMFGEYPWGEKIPFMHRYARKVRYVGHGWESHVKTVVEPELKKWWPGNRVVVTKKNNQGVEALWTDKITGSTLEIMSNNQESDTFEGWSGDLIIWDEPPSRDNRIAAARGLVDRQGRELFVATLLKEAWIHRDIIKAKDEFGQPDKSVWYRSAEIGVNVGFGLTQAGVDQFAKTLNRQERQARLEGRPSFLDNVVFHNFDRERNVIPRFRIPDNYVIRISIDFHPSKPWVALWHALGPKDYGYFCDFLEMRGGTDQIVDEIVRINRKNGYNVKEIIVDPLARGDGNQNDGDTFSQLERRFRAYNYKLSTASKAKESGIQMLNDRFLTENNLPSLFVFSDMTPVWECLEDLMYDPETLKPSKEKDDFAEMAYRLMLISQKPYEDPRAVAYRLSNLPPCDPGDINFG